MAEKRPGGDARRPRRSGPEGASVHQPKPHEEDDWEEDLTPEGRILAIDWGERRVGFAVTDPTGTIAVGLPTEEVRGEEDMVHAVERHVAHYGVVQVIVGLPVGMDGREGERAAKVRAFVDALVETLDIPVDTWDERLTSRQAESALRDQGRKPSREKGEVDRIAATLLLQSYMDSAEA